MRKTLSTIALVAGLAITGLPAAASAAAPCDSTKGPCGPAACDVTKDYCGTEPCDITKGFCGVPPCDVTKGPCPTSARTTAAQHRRVPKVHPHRSHR